MVISSKLGWLLELLREQKNISYLFLLFRVWFRLKLQCFWKFMRQVHYHLFVVVVVDSWLNFSDTSSSSFARFEDFQRGFLHFFRLLFLNICPPSRFWFQREGGNWFWSWSSPFLSQNNFEIRHQQQQYTSPHNHSETMFILIPSQINQIDICSLSYASNLMSLTAPPPQYQPFLK